MRSSSVYSETGVTSDEWIDLEETDTETYYDAQDKNPFVRASNVRQEKFCQYVNCMCVYVVLSETGLKKKIMQKKFREINFHQKNLGSQGKKCNKNNP